MYINTDGGSRGNPGPAAIGIVFFDDKEKEIHHFKKAIGRATNNEAEYQAIISALDILLKSKWFSENNHNKKEVVCRLDSQLVVEQINGNYKIKQDHIKLLIAQLRQMISQMNLNISFVHIPREENKIADRLVNEALDNES
ncbi:MAG: putative phosphoglycerate mutase [Candidatus Berkelbacteria bacterium Athens1014_28]|uniref:Putative phosphoglycerate mutase n=1 Tax=Candidatus Berkelbacteria bacterium Athens1014_28 TaxID=2017145 RepID=A0A554LIW8_9BACT|nr:MAG: putative phosphoglycerate mutase [Candidatus Berkelbacteria bacterium Athens1014_28]